MRLNSQGVENIDPMNMGGTLDQGGFTVSMVRADHSSSHNDNGTAVYLGNPGGLIVKAPNEPTIYHMGDTDIFSDMALINEIYAPDVAFVPVGDRFTMSPKLAAMAVKKFFKLKSVIPCHYGSFPIIEPNADKFIAEMKGAATKVIVPEKGKAVTV
jgi:L-ascorbate metabolism protein UlaG (beta-lactamase superfamily)